MWKKNQRVPHIFIYFVNFHSTKLIIHVFGFGFARVRETNDTHTILFSLVYISNEMVNEFMHDRVHVLV